MATLKTVTCTIPAGESLSNSADCRGSIRILRCITPDAWTRAPLTFQLSVDNVEFNDLYHTSPENYDPFEVVGPEVVPDSVSTLPPSMSYTVHYVKVRSGTRAVPVRQSADRIFKMVLEMPEVPPPGPTGATGPIGPPGTTGATGAAAGWQLVQNVLNCWGTTTASTTGSQVLFPRAYRDGNPVVTVAGQAGGVLQVTVVSLTGFTVTCNSGTPTVYWRAVGS